MSGSDVPAAGTGGDDAAEPTAAEVGEPATLDVSVLPVEVDGEVVTLRWLQSRGTPWQKRQSFTVRYPGLALDAFAPAIWNELFLGLQLGVLALHPGPITLTLPMPVHPSSVAFWAWYHGVEDLRVEPISESAVGAWRPGRRGPGSRTAVAVFLGGGKDSTLARCGLAEVHGEDQVPLVQLAHHWVDTRRAAQALSERQRRFTLDPVRATTAHPVLEVQTDFLANLTAEGRRGRPHTNLYLVLGLPVVLASGVGSVAMSNELTSYWTATSASGARRFGYPRSRPEVYRWLGRMWSEVLGPEAPEPGNTHLPISELASYAVLRDRYPAGFQQIVMCGAATTQKWCGSCKKCAEYAHFGLLTGGAPPEVDASWWTRSRYLARLSRYLRDDPPRDAAGLVRWDPLMGTGFHLASLQHTMTVLGEDAELVPEAARPVLQPLVDQLARGRWPFLEQLSADAARLQDAGSLTSLFAIYAQHVPILTGPVLAVPYKRTLVDYRFGALDDVVLSGLSTGSVVPGPRGGLR